MNTYYHEFLDKYSYDRYLVAKKIYSKKFISPIISPIETKEKIPLQFKEDNLDTVFPLLKYRRSNMSGINKLSILSHFTLGVLRYEPENNYKLHRGVPSARGIHPCELYYAACQENFCGIYRFNPMESSFELINEDHSFFQLKDAIGKSISEKDVVAIITCDMWRLGKFYGDFTFNLATLDAGHIVSQLGIIAGRMGIQVELYYCFIDQVVCKCLGIDYEQVYPCMVLVLKDCFEKKTVNKGVCNGHLCARRLVSYSEEMLQLADLQRIVKSSEITINEFCRNELLWSNRNKKYIYSKAISKTKDRELLDCIFKRTSAQSPIGISGIPMQISKKEIEFIFSQIFDFSKASGLNEWINQYAFLNNVEGYEKGFYKMSPINGRLMEVVSSFDYLYETYNVLNDSQEYLNLGSMPIIFFYSVNIEKFYCIFGDRGIQIMNIMSGELCQGTSLILANFDMFVRPIKNIKDKFLENAFFVNMKTERFTYALLTGKSIIRNIGFKMY